MMDTIQRQQETKPSTTVTGPAETSEGEGQKYGVDGADLDVTDIEANVHEGTSVGTQDDRENIGGSPAGGVAGTGGVSTNDVGQKGPGKQMDPDR